MSCLAASHVSSLHGRPILAAWIASSSLLGPPVSAMGHLLRNVALCHWQLEVTLSVPVHGEQMNEMPYTSMDSRAISLCFPYCTPNCWRFRPVYQLGSQSLRGIWCPREGSGSSQSCTTCFHHAARGPLLGSVGMCRSRGMDWSPRWWSGGGMAVG